MILNQSQAEAVYSAMCALNNVGGRVDARIPEDGAVVTRVCDTLSGEIHISIENRIVLGSSEIVELHEDQSAFATAYGLGA